MKTQLEPAVRVEGAQDLWLGPARIEDGQDMSNARLAMEPQLIDPANRHLEGHQAL